MKNHDRSHVAKSLLQTTALAGLAVTLGVTGQAGSAYAQVQQTAQAPRVEEIVVTGSRIIRDGYEAPTPVTVVGVEEIQNAAKPNVFDAIATMPAFAGNTNITSSNVNISGGIGGASTLNLRRMGVNRTLVLLDGRRFPNIFVSGGTDAKLFPDLLISRVDVVTGGASAVYGSDAVSGVVNFVLDTEFTGLKGNIMGGVTARGDHRQYKIAAAGGTPFGGGRGHFLINADYGYQSDMNGNTRDWNQQGWARIPNPAYATDKTKPQLLVRNHAGLWAANPGGVIAGGPLKGIAFGPGGTPYMFNFGDYVASSFNINGDWTNATEQGANSLSAGVIDKHFFTHASYDLTDNVSVFAQFAFGTVNSTNSVAWTYYLGSNITVKPDNPFIPSSVAAQVSALKLTGFLFGKALHDVPEYAAWNQRNSFVYTVGAKGNFSALDTNWKWDVYAQRGLNKLDLNSPIQIRKTNFALAIDAVRASNGSIVCRSTLTNPTNGCVPYNLFGTPGVNSQAAINYVTAMPNHPHNSQGYGSNSAAANISGEPFSDWAGPVSMSAGVEWRKESISGTADPIALAKDWYSTNYISWPYVSESVVEGNLETVVPLAKDTAWARSLDFNGAVRVTNYSVSGSAVTWKAGLTYNPIDDLRFRFTQSRDIRAPNLNDLYAPGQLGHGAITDPFQGNRSYEFGSVTKGNTALEPEKADTTGIGAVYQPSWFTGFSTSVDYYDIRLHGAIASPGSELILNQCHSGVTAYCGFIHRDSAGILQSIDAVPVNASTLWARGLDIEASYRTPLDAIVDSWDGNLAVRLVATHVIAYKQLDKTLSVATGSISDNAPSWNGQLTVSYSNDPIRFNWTEQYISSGKMYQNMIECASNCPVPVPAGLQTIEKNYVPSYYLTNISIAYALFKDGGNNAEVYFNVDNLFDRDPNPIGVTGVAYAPQTSAQLYDVYGRSFRLGVRFKM
ncbi:MAG: TonB-dependent receptor plug domain-containing protein [Rhodospirillaceae bacterium]